MLFANEPSYGDFQDLGRCPPAATTILGFPGRAVVAGLACQWPLLLLPGAVQGCACPVGPGLGGFWVLALLLVVVARPLPLLSPNDELTTTSPPPGPFFTCVSHAAPAAAAGLNARCDAAPFFSFLIACRGGLPPTGRPSHNARPPTWPATHALGGTRTTLEPESRHETSCRIVRAKGPTTIAPSPLNLDFRLPYLLSNLSAPLPTSLLPPSLLPILNSAKPGRQSQPTQTYTPARPRPPPG